MTLDDDLAIHLERRRAERGMSFKEALNDAVRRGLAADAEFPGPAQAVAETEPLQLGRRLIDVDNVAEALAVAEGEAFR